MKSKKVHLINIPGFENPAMAYPNKQKITNNVGSYNFSNKDQFCSIILPKKYLKFIKIEIDLQVISTSSYLTLPKDLIIVFWIREQDKRDLKN